MTHKNHLVGLSLIVLNSLSLGLTAGGVKYLENIDYWPPNGILLLTITIVIIGLIAWSVNMIMKKNRKENFYELIPWLCIIILTYPFVLYCFQGLFYLLPAPRSAWNFDLSLMTLISRRDGLPLHLAHPEGGIFKNFWGWTG